MQSVIPNNRSNSQAPHTLADDDVAVRFSHQTEMVISHMSFWLLFYFQNESAELPRP